MDGLRVVLRFVARSTRRLTILVVGLLVVLLGIILIPLPGPGWAVVFLGLAILATEFAWAEYLLNKAKTQASRATLAANRVVRERWRARRYRTGPRDETPADDQQRAPTSRG